MLRTFAVLLISIYFASVSAQVCTTIVSAIPITFTYNVPTNSSLKAVLFNFDSTFPTNTVITQTLGPTTNNTIEITGLYKKSGTLTGSVTATGTVSGSNFSIQFSFIPATETTSNNGITNNSNETSVSSSVSGSTSSEVSTSTSDISTTSTTSDIPTSTTSDIPTSTTSDIPASTTSTTSTAPTTSTTSTTSLSSSTTSESDKTDALALNPMFAVGSALLLGDGSPASLALALSLSLQGCEAQGQCSELSIVVRIPRSFQIECIPGTNRTCRGVNGNGIQLCTAQGLWPVCELQVCDSGYLLDATKNLCLLCLGTSTDNCTISNGYGIKTCNSGNWGPCIATGCNAGYTLNSGFCSNVCNNGEICDVTNAPPSTGQLVCSSPTTGSCVLTTGQNCLPTYLPNPERTACLSDPCSLITCYGSGTCTSGICSPCPTGFAGDGVICVLDPCFFNGTSLCFGQCSTIPLNFDWNNGASYKCSPCPPQYTDPAIPPDGKVCIRTKK